MSSGPLSNEQLEQVLEKTKELGQLQLVDRRILRYSGDRHESTAEHSWELAMFAWLLLPHYEEKLNLEKVIKLALLHDVVEIYAGDTYAFDSENRKTKHAREDSAWEQLFPEGSEKSLGEMRTLWREYALRKSKEAEFVAGLDKLIPMVHRAHTLEQEKTGPSDLQHPKVSEAEIRKYKEPQLKHSPLLMQIFDSLLSKMRKLGFFEEQ